jgi:hypothetical protein
MQRGGGRALRRARIGAIFIEFAVVIPILIAVVYYLHDLSKEKHIRNKVEFCVHCAVNMFQNISAKRENKKITSNDIRRIAHTVSLPYFRGIEMLPIGDCYPRGMIFVMVILYVKGFGNNTAKVVWTEQGSLYEYTDSIDKIQCWPNHYDSPCISNTYYTIGRIVNCNSIHPELKINKDEEKVIIYLSFWTSFGLKYYDRVYVSTANAKRLFGFYVLPIKLKSGSNGLFTASVIFTPKSGLFDENVPVNESLPS